MSEKLNQEQTEQKVNSELTPEEEALLQTLQDPDRPRDPNTPVPTIAEAEAKIKAGQEKETHLTETRYTVLGTMLHDAEFLANCKPIIDKTYFRGEYEKRIIRILYGHWEKYGTLPEKYAFQQEIETVVRKDKEGSDESEIKTALVKTRQVYYTCYDNYVARDKNYLRDLTINYVKRAKFFNLAESIAKGANENEIDSNTWANEAAEIASLDITETYERRGYSCEELDEQPAPVWQIEDHFQTNTVNVCFGPWGGGKTFYVIDLGLSVATGKKFLGKYDVTQGPVCYVGAEGRAGQRQRIRAWREVMGITPTKEQFVALPAPFRLMELAEGREIIRIAKKHLGTNPSLVIIDTLNKHFGGGDENSTKDMSAFLTTCVRLQHETGATFVIVHHTGHDLTKGPKGNTALPAGADTIISITGNPRNKIKINCYKQKDAAPFEDYYLTGTPVPSESSLVLSQTTGGKENKAETDEDKVLEQIPICDLADMDTTDGTSGVQQSYLIGLLSGSVSEKNVRCILKQLVENQMIGKWKPEGASAKIAARYYRPKLLFS